MHFPGFKSGDKSAKIRTMGIFLAVIIASSFLAYSAGSSFAVSSSNVTTLSKWTAVDECDYLIFNAGSTTYAKNCETGAIDYSGTTDSTVIQSAADALTTGGKIVFVEGTYTLAAAITSSYDIIFEGQGYATELASDGNHAVFSFSGTTARPQVKDMLIRGGGASNANAHCVVLSNTNEVLLEDLYLHACRNAIDVTESWQDKLTNLSIFGSGADQNYVGIYTHAVAAASDNTALIVDNVIVKDTQSHGIRLEQVSGSKWNNVEVADAGDKCWYIGSPANANRQVEFMHATNIVADTCTNEAYYIDGTGALNNLATDFQWANIWAGSSKNAMYLDDAVQMEFTNIHFKTFTQHAVYVDTGSYRLEFNNGGIYNWGTSSASTYSGFYLDSTIRSGIRGVNMQATSPHTSIREVNTANYNRFLINDLNDAGSVSITGASTMVRNNVGFITESVGTGTIASGTTSVTVNHGLSYTPAAGEIEVSWTENPTNDPGNWWISNITSTQFTVNVRSDPGASHLDFQWSIRKV